MALGSFATGALADLDQAALARMLELDETVYVEHKRGLGGRDDGFQVARAVAAFANTAGGWVLVGVENGTARRRFEDWAGTAAATFGDRVRDVVRSRVDPLPPFETKLVADDDGDVGIVRVYESSDTPHVMVADGAVYVREGAGVSDARPTRESGALRRSDRQRWAATQVRRRDQLVELARRGDAAEARVAGLILALDPPLIATLGLRFEAFEAIHAEVPEGIYIRMAPYTLTPRFRDWATTEDAGSAILAAAGVLAGWDGLTVSRLDALLNGAATHTSLNKNRFVDGLRTSVDGMTHVAIAGVGVVGASLILAPRPVGPGMPAYDRHEFARVYVEPVLKAATSILERGEFIGRALAHVDLVRIGTAMNISLPHPPATHVSIDVDLTVPPCEDDLRAAALRITNAVARSGGSVAFDTPAAG